MTIELIDARSDSLTVTWPVVDGAKRYILELKPATDATDDDDDVDDGFRELSSKLTQPQAKKKNLDPGAGYFFRVAPVMEKSGEAAAAAGSWTTHPEAFRTLSREDGESCLEAPATVPGGNHALFVKWKAGSGGATGYELQMRENKGGEGWTTLAASLSGTEVRKKNLLSPSGYQFRVRPSGSAAAFSPPSEAAVARGGVSEALRRRWFSGLRSPGTLLKKGSAAPVSLADALGGKEFVLFYVSAHWCPPCRRFTPILATWYQSHHHLAEIVFVSADHDIAQFQSYFAASHPWAAIDYDRDATAREQIMAALKVSGIPRLAVVSAATGAVLVDNAVNASLDVNQWRAIAAGGGAAPRTAAFPSGGGGGGGCCSGSSCDRFGNCS